MAFSPGYKAYIGLDNAALSLQNLSTYADDFSFPQSVEQLEVTTFSAAGTYHKNFIPGLAGGDTVAVSGPLDTTLHSHVSACIGSQALVGSTFSLIYGPAGSVSGAPKISAEVWIAKYEPTTGVGGRAEFSADLQVTGAITNATW